MPQNVHDSLDEPDVTWEAVPFDVIGTVEVSPTTTSSSSPQEGFNETRDEKIALSEMPHKEEVSLTNCSSRRGFEVEYGALEQIGNCASVVFSMDRAEKSPEKNAVGNQGPCPNVGSQQVMCHTAANDKIGRFEEDKRQENSGIVDEQKTLENTYNENLFSSSFLKRKFSMNGVPRNFSQKVGDVTGRVAESVESCHSFTVDSGSSGSPHKDKSSLLSRIIRSPSLTKRGSIGSVLNSLYPNSNKEKPLPFISTAKAAAGNNLSQTKESATVENGKPKDVEKCASNSESLETIVQTNVLNHCQVLQRKRRNSIASSTPLTGASDTFLRVYVENGKWNSGDISVRSSDIASNTKSDLNKSNDYNKINITTQTYSSEDVSHSCNGHGRSSHGEVHGELKTLNPSHHSPMKGKPQTKVDRRAASPKSKRFEGDGLNDAQMLSEQTSLAPHEKTTGSTPLSSGIIDSPQRKSSVTIIKRPPVALVISNNKSGRTEVRRNSLENQVSSGVSFINSCFIPLGQEEAEEYSIMKEEEERKSSKNASLNSKFKMSSGVAVSCGQNGRIMRKSGTAENLPPLNDSLPTNDRFVALSERYAALKAKIRGIDIKEKNQVGSFAASPMISCSPETNNALELSKRATAVEIARIEELQDRVSGNCVGARANGIEERLMVESHGNQREVGVKEGINVHHTNIVCSERDIAKNVDEELLRRVDSVHDDETNGNITWGTSVDENNNDITSDFHNTTEIQVSLVEVRPGDKTTLDFRPESAVQRTRTSVVAKLMNRKMIIRKRQSVVPRMVKRQSMIYNEHFSTGCGIPRTVEQFERIRTFVENTMLRAPVRQEALTIKELLNGLSSCLTERELVAICKECAKTLRTLDALGSLPSYVSLESVIINPSGTIKFKQLRTGISIDDFYLAPEYSTRFTSEKANTQVGDMKLILPSLISRAIVQTCVFSLAATVWSAADWRLTEAEKPSLSLGFQELLVSMTDDDPDARPSLHNVLQTCDSLQTEGDMTSREKCQALLWEYQASAAVRKDDAGKRKTLEEEKKQHDTLMGSIAVAASCKGFLKQAPRPQEQNPFVRTQAHREQRNQTDSQLLKEIPANDAFVEVENKSKEIRNNEEDVVKGVSSFAAKSDFRSIACDANNNLTAQNPRYSLTEEQKEQLLSLLASTSLRPDSNSFERRDKEQAGNEPIGLTKTTLEHNKVKPSSPSVYSYPHFAQAENCAVFDPITPAGRSMSPNMYSNTSESQRSAVPKFVPIAVPVPSVTPVPMSPFWYIPQGGLMPYPQPAMSPVQFVPVDTSMASNQPVISPDSDVSEVFDGEPRTMKASSAFPRPDGTNVGSSSQTDVEQGTRRSPSLRDKKASKLPRPIWQTGTKSRSIPTELEKNSNVIRQRIPTSDQTNTSDNEKKRVRARSPSPHIGRRSSADATPSPRSQTPPVNRSTDGVDTSAKPKLQKRMSVGSLPNSRPSSPNSPDVFHRSKSRSSSLLQKSGGNTENRTTSSAGSRSNSPVSNRISKRESSSSDICPWTRRNSVSSMITKFGSSSLLNEDRIVKGQLKPNGTAAATRKSSKTGPFRQSMNSGGASECAPKGNPVSSHEKPISGSKKTTTMSFDSDELLFKVESGDQRKVQRNISRSLSNDNKRQDFTAQSRRRLSSSLQSLHKATEAGSDRRLQDSTMRLSKGSKKWSSQDNIVGDIRLNAPQMNESGISFDNAFVTAFKVIPDEKDSLNTRPETEFTGKSSSLSFPSKDSSISIGDLRNGVVINTSNSSERRNNSFLTELARRSSLDSEPVREKAAPKPRQNEKTQPYDVKGSGDFVRSPITSAQKFETPVDLSLLGSTFATFPTQVSSSSQLRGGKEGSTLPLQAQVDSGLFKEFKSSDYFTNVNLKLGEMEPERDTDCFEKPKLLDKEGRECNAGNAKTDDPVMQFDRKVLRGTSGDAKDERSVRVLQHDIAKDTSLSSSMADKSCGNSATQSASSSTETLTTSKTSKIHSAIDPVTASRNHLGENGQFSKERLNASSARDPRSPLILRKLLSNPLPKGDNVSRPLSASAKRISLPTPKPGKVSTKPDVSLTCKESSSRSYLLPDQKQTQNNSSEKDILSSTASKKPVLALEKNGEPMEKNNPIYSKLNNPHSKEDDVGTKGPTSTTSYSRNISNSPSSSKRREVSQERKPNSSNPYVQPAKTNIEVSDAPQNSASGYIRYPYTRRASTPAKENSTSKLPAKSASNPTLRADLRETQKFFTPPITCLGDSMGSRNPIDSNIDRSNVSQKGVQPDEKTNWRNESNEVGGMPSSSVGSSPMASPSGSVLRVSSTFASPTKATFVDQASSEHNLGDSGVFHVPSFEEHFSNGESISMETTGKRFPSNASSDSGLNICDPEDTQRSNRNSNEHRKQGVQRNPDCTSSPQTPKFLIGSNIFYDPRVDRQSNINFSETRLASMGNEPQNLANMLSSGGPREAAIPSKNTPTDSKHSPNKTVGNDGDKVKNPKGLVLSIQDKKSPDAIEDTDSHPDKRKGAKTVLNAETIAGILKSTSKGKLSPSTPPPDITGRLSGKSPPSPSSSSNLASKELLGQLVKKVLNTAAAKQGSSPKASFAESSSLTEGEQSKEKQSNKVVVSSSPRHTSEVKGKERSSGKGKITSAENSNQEQRCRESHETPKGKCQVQLPETGSPSNFKETSVTPRDLSQAEISLVQVEDQSCESKEKDALSRIIDLIHDEFAFDGYLDDGVEDVNMAEYVLSLAGMSGENFNEAIRDQYSDLYWDEDLLRAMYQAVACGQETTRSSESTVCDMSPSTSSNLSREESYLSLEPLYLNSISRSSSERSGAGARDVLVSPLGEATEFLPIKVIAPDMQMYIQGLLEPIFEDYHRIMGIKLASSIDDLSDKLGTKIMEISQQLTLERRAKKKCINSYNKTADVENKKDVKELALKLVNEIEESDKKIVYLKRVQWQLRNVYAERFGLDTSLLHSFLVSYKKTCVTLEPELNNSFLNFSPIWNQRMNENNDIVDESFLGPSLQSGTKLGLFSYLFDRHAISQSFVRYFFYTYRYVASSQELFNFIRDKCSASLRTDSSGQVYNHQLQIRYRSLDLMSEWIDGYYQFDFKTNLNLIEELLTFVKDELILVDRSERGHYLMELIAEKQNRDSNNNSLSEETVDSVAVLQMEDPQGLSVMEGKKDSPRKPLGSRKSKSPVQCFRRASTEVETTYKATLYLKALSVLDHSSRVLAEQLTLIQQDLFADVHPVHFLNSRAHGIGVGRNQSPTRERDSIFGFSTGNRRFSEFPAPDQGPLLCGNNLYASEPISDGTLEQVLEHAQDVSLWVAVEICSASSVKGQLALITKFVNAAHYCCEIRNYATCIQIVDALEMFVVRQLPVWKQVPTKTTEILEELKAVKVLLKTDSSWLMRSESSREKPTIPCFLLFVIHVQQQELGGFTLPSDMYKWTKMRCVARLVDQLRLFKQMRYAFQTDEELKDRLKQRIHECKNENLHALASENASNFYLSSSHGSRKFHDAFKKMKATFGGFN